MLNFRDVLVGKNGPGLASESWPELSSTAKPIPQNVKAVEDTVKIPEEKLQPMKIPEIKETKIRNKHKKINPKKLPYTFDVLEAIQESLLKKNIKLNIKNVKKTKNLKKYSGNKLDSDEPVLRKGKVRPNKNKRNTRIKKIILISRQTKTPFNYTENILDAKNGIASALKNGDLTNITQSLDKLKLETNSQIANLDQENELALAVLHSRKFKSYCKNLITPKLKKEVEELISSLRKFQDRLHAQNEIKAHAKRRYVCGIQESKKFLKANKVKLMIVATNLEMDQGLPSNDILKEVEDIAMGRDTPVIYAGTGEEIGYWTLKKRKISLVAILNYDGAQIIYQNLLEEWKSARSQYNAVLDEIKESFRNKTHKVELTDVEKQLRDSIILKLSKKD